MTAQRVRTQPGRPSTSAGRSFRRCQQIARRHRQVILPVASSRSLRSPKIDTKGRCPTDDLFPLGKSEGTAENRLARTGPSLLFFDVYGCVEGVEKIWYPQSSPVRTPKVNEVLQFVQTIDTLRRLSWAA
jgi:hypothetical protein